MPLYDRGERAFIPVAHECAQDIAIGLPQREWGQTRVQRFHQAVQARVRHSHISSNYPVVPRERETVPVFLLLKLSVALQPRSGDRW
jgi:hypothetical protein